MSRFFAAFTVLLIHTGAAYAQQTPTELAPFAQGPGTPPGWGPAADAGQSTPAGPPVPAGPPAPLSRPPAPPPSPPPPPSGAAEYPPGYGPASWLCSRRADTHRRRRPLRRSPAGLLRTSAISRVRTATFHTVLAVSPAPIRSAPLLLLMHPPPMRLRSVTDRPFTIGGGIGFGGLNLDEAGRSWSQSGMAYTARLGLGLRPGLILLWDIEGAVAERGNSTFSQMAQPRGAADVRRRSPVPQGGLRSRAGRPGRRALYRLGTRHHGRRRRRAHPGVALVLRRGVDADGRALHGRATRTRPRSTGRS